MRESSQTIAQWARETFGVGTTAQVASRMLCESAELVEMIAEDRTQPEGTWDECADVGVMLLQVVWRLNDGGLLLGLELDRQVRGLIDDAERLRYFTPETARGTRTFCLRKAARLNSDLARMSAALSNLGMQVIPSEELWKSLHTLCLGCVEDLWALGRSLGCDVGEQVDKKMVRNRRRKWGRTTSGVWQHTEEGTT